VTLYRVGTVVRSVKNTRSPIEIGRRCPWCKRGQRTIYEPSPDAKRDREHVRSVLEGAGDFCTIPRENDVRLDMTWLVAEDAIEWEVHDLGPRDPKKRKGRQDLQGIIEALADAIQGYQVENDSQIAEIRASKRY
jgi:hypothetical protein